MPHSFSDYSRFLQITLHRKVICGIGAVMEPPLILRNDAHDLEALIAAGRRASALDGRHLLGWGLAAASVLALQYAAEVGDWLPSRLLWLWQPLALFGFVAAIFVTPRGAGRRLGHPVARAYTIVFGIAGVALAGFLLAAGSGSRPDGLVAILVVTGMLGAAFIAVGLATPLRWMALPGVGWLSLAAFYAAEQVVIPIDWLRIAFAFAVLLALPGAILITRASR